jgi:hypothetical protein
MQTARDRHPLLDRLDYGPLSALATLGKCVAGILILLAVVAAPWPIRQPGDEVAATGPRYGPLRLAHSEEQSVEAAKRVFDERRQSYELNRSRRQRIADR